MFFHASDVAKTSILATQIANQLEAQGWSVTRGYTELEIHSRGVWVHGSTDQERQFARHLLAQMDIEARVDDRAEEVPLQIIVGCGEHERRQELAQEQPAVRTQVALGTLNGPQTGRVSLPFPAWQLGWTSSRTSAGRLD